MRDQRGRWRTAAVAAALTVATTAAFAVDTDTQLIYRVRGAVIKYKLADRPDRLTYQIIRKVHPGVDQVKIRELQDANCGGDPDTEPRLFDFLVNRETGKMATTALDPDDLQFVRLK